jgi:hypothetical protein
MKATSRKRSISRATPSTEPAFDEGAEVEAANKRPFPFGVEHHSVAARPTGSGQSRQRFLDRRGFKSGRVHQRRSSTLSHGIEPRHRTRRKGRAGPARPRCPAIHGTRLWVFNSASRGGSDGEVRPRHHEQGETSMLRISRGETGFNADTLHQARERLGREEPGLYRVDDIRADPFPSGHTLRAWGGLIRHADGRIVVEPQPWD